MSGFPVYALHGHSTPESVLDILSFPHTLFSRETCIILL